MRIIDFLKKKIRADYEPYNKLEISFSALANNYNFLKKHSGKEIIPVLKSNAYGHGLKQISQLLDKLGISLVAVDSFPEAQIVWKYSRAKVLFLSDLPLEAYKYCPKKRSQFCVSTSQVLTYLAHNFPGSQIHLFINSGLNREGFKETKAILENLDSLKKLKIIGLGTHLAAEKTFSEQVASFKIIKKELEPAGIKPEIIHLGGSDALVSPVPVEINYLRIGLAFYGYGLAGVKPALRVFSRAIGQQRVLSGEGVSYGPDYVAASPKNIALIPFGYFEGLEKRFFSDKEVFFPRLDFKAPIVGRICMNLCLVDVGDREVPWGEKVEVMSLQNYPEIYEILVGLNHALRREIVL